MIPCCFNSQAAHGLAQKTQSNNKYDKKLVAADVFSQAGIRNPTLWRAWELDGVNLDEFQFRYGSVLRALIEGRFSLYFVAVDQNGNFEHVGVLNVLQGVLTPNQIYFSSNNGYRIFSSIETFDSQFKTEFDQVMGLFKRYPLPFVPRSDQAISDSFNFLF